MPMVCWFNVFLNKLPSGYLLHSHGIDGPYPLVISHGYGKSPFFMGKFTIHGDFP